MIRNVLIAAALVVAALQGCGQMTARDTSALTAEQRIATATSEAVAAGYVGVTQTRRLALDLLRTGDITPDQAQAVNEQLDGARSALDVTRQLLHVTPPDPAGANAQLQRATQAIGTARTLIATRRAAP